MALNAGPIHNFGASTDQLRKFLRRAGGLQPGAVSAASFKVSQNGTPNLSVSIASGYALVDSPTSGLYVAQSDATVTTAAGGAIGHGSLPRIDRVILKISDKLAMGSPSDGAQLLIRLGTPTFGAALDNYAGAAGVGSGELLLADLLMPAGWSTYINGNIRDRRPYAAGVRTTIVGNSAGNVTTTSTTDVGAASHTTPRIEIGPGNALVVSGTVNLAASAGTAVARVRVASANPAVTAYTPTVGIPGANSFPAPITGYPLPSAAAGSYVATLLWSISTAGTATMQNNASIYTAITLQEIVGGFQDNS